MSFKLAVLICGSAITDFQTVNVIYHLPVKLHISISMSITHLSEAYYMFKRRLRLCLRGAQRVGWGRGVSTLCILNATVPSKKAIFPIVQLYRGN
jgi:hypothetical protein